MATPVSKQPVSRCSGEHSYTRRQGRRGSRAGSAGSAQNQPQPSSDLVLRPSPGGWERVWLVATLLASEPPPEACPDRHVVAPAVRSWALGPESPLRPAPASGLGHPLACPWQPGNRFCSGRLGVQSTPTDLSQLHTGGHPLHPPAQLPLQADTGSQGPEPHQPRGPRPGPPPPAQDLSALTAAPGRRGPGPGSCPLSKRPWLRGRRGTQGW